MRFVSTLLMLVFLAILVGCGDKGGSGEPAVLTPEEEQKQKETQRQAYTEERSHVASKSGVRAPTAEDQERLRRGH